ncbi:outer membrane protein assembly factor BamD [Salipiger pallidus]|uniref:Outer membrane protein assembly factor BamD n=1 Tax=Salipiger pallidus TaxID=1775170 RepID=A0A8J2ZKS3_9RHOB|nr:outer membrane protein assembly factor BamD [Salipiger pallidus]GGG74740.1 outer membrane protein assembly factor BamD [Salipiger pallidus]
MAGGTARGLVIGAGLVAIFLAGCTARERPGYARGNVPLETYSAQQIFERGAYELERKDGEQAAYYFGEVERLYPYSDWSKPALIEQARAYHLEKDYDNARAAAQRYIEFYPTDENAAYAQYLLALSYYDQIELVGRDQGLTYEALEALRAVIERYPESEYARSSVLKFDLAFDHLAAKEMEIGRYYLKRQNFGAALNRFRSVVEDFQTTTHTPEALHRLVEAYLSLGLTDEAQTAGAILGYNYQGTDWYEDSYKLLTGRGLEMRSVGDNWLSAVYRQTVRGEWL